MFLKVLPKEVIQLTDIYGESTVCQAQEWDSEQDSFHPHRTYSPIFSIEKKPTGD